MTTDKRPITAGIKITADVMVLIRARVKELIAEGYTVYRDMAKTLALDFPKFRAATLVDYAVALDPTKTSDALLKRVTDGKMSVNMFCEIAQSTLDIVTKDTLAHECMIYPPLKTSQVAEIKRLIKKGHGLGTAVLTVRNQIPKNAKTRDLAKATKALSGIERELNDSSIWFQASVEKMMRTIPDSAKADISTWLDLYHKLTVLQQVVSNAARYLDGAVPRFYELVKKASTMEATMDIQRTDGGLLR